MLAILVLAIVLQISPPAHGGQQQKPPDKKTDIAKPSPSPAPVPIVENQKNPSKESNTPAAEPQKIPEKSFWGDLPTWMLVFVGGIAAWIAVCTLRDIRKQTENAKTTADAAQKSAEAALKNAQAVIDAERAWVMVDLEEVPGFPIVETWQDGETVHRDARFRLRYVNEGKTIAWIDEIWACFRIREHLHPNPDFNELEMLTLDREWLGRKGNGYRDSTLLTESMEPSVIWGFVKYRDAFGEHKTVFGFHIQPDGKFQRLRTQHHRYNENT
jgi:hypothetical protein